MTYSIVAKEGEKLGVAVATGSVYVRSRVPHVKRGVGAIATQGYTEVSYGTVGLKLLEEGYSPKEALEILLKRDPGREYRQVIMIDAKGRKSAFTGKRTPDFKGHIIGENFVVAGNLIAGEEVLRAMVAGFRRGKSFEERLLLALDYGRDAGGDRRGERSCALIVESDEGRLDLSVDDSPDPIGELKILIRRL
ncbi:DUF1028 domain-containing protein [Archaeoglobus profundus]|uniref:DUF1028 domain-containing protein n=1 Tax=Archaeoglobus profundus (strain DSM 5631 / JCM 9629 / NBRC 100127 / Av18) TaxID=572546 RepID=D2RDP5_ARCPA|nr:DUF1028 domain-containing protein [Archaeoglobus profundus]ADB58239.1 protein of unknown function DUF1028 [Archaeoglobus profundus DSM 5631]